MQRSNALCWLVTSMGTPIARQFYRKYPDQTLAIVIVDGPLRPFGEKAMMDAMTRQLSRTKLQRRHGPNVCRHVWSESLSRFKRANSGLTPKYAAVRFGERVGRDG